VVGNASRMKKKKKNVPTSARHGQLITKAKFSFEEATRSTKLDSTTKYPCVSEWRKARNKDEGNREI
jgi:hypothetical protein